MYQGSTIYFLCPFFSTFLVEILWQSLITGISSGKISMRGLCLALSRQDGLILAVQSLNNEIGSEFGIAYAMLKPHALTSRPMLCCCCCCLFVLSSITFPHFNQSTVNDQKLLQLLHIFKSLIWDKLIHTEIFLFSIYFLFSKASAPFQLLLIFQK